MSRHNPPSSPDYGYQAPRSWWSRNWPWVIAVAGCAAVFCIGSGVAIVLLFIRVDTQLDNYAGTTMAGPTPGVTSEYYYDLNTEELFVTSANQIPPIDTGSGAYNPSPGVTTGAGVKAYVFSCGDCSDPGKRFIGYLERYSPQMHQKLTQLSQQLQQQGGPAMPIEAYLMYEEGTIGGRLIKRVEDEQWVSADGPEGITIINELSQQCPQDRNQRLRPCFP